MRGPSETLPPDKRWVIGLFNCYSKLGYGRLLELNSKWLLLLKITLPLPIAKLHITYFAKMFVI